MALPLHIAAKSLKVSTGSSHNMFAATPSYLDTAAALQQTVPYAEIKRDYDILWEPTQLFSKSTKPVTLTFVSRIIRAWKTLVAPHTPPYGFSCPPSDLFLDYILLLLTGIYMALATADRKLAATMSSHIAPLWPDIWTWLRTFHTHALPLHELYGVSGQLKGYRMALRILSIAVFVHPPTTLSILMTETEGVFETMATMWIEEGKDESGKLGFKASSLIFSSHSNSSTTLPGVLSQILAHCDGSLDAAGAILLRRIKNNAKQAEPDWIALEQDLKHLEVQLPLKGHTTPGSAILRQALLSHPMFAKVLVDVLSTVLEVKTSEPTTIPTQTKALRMLLIVILRHFHITGYNCAAQLIGANIISLIARLAQTYGSDDYVAQASGHLLQSVISRFTIYRPVLSATIRNLAASDVYYMMRRSSGPIGQHIFDLASRVDEYAKILGMQIQHAFCCSFPQVRLVKCDLPILFSYFSQCSVIDSERNFRRCSGCKFVLYCSSGCQKKHWHEEHKIRCSEMCSTSRGQLFSP